jgi:hypothetical protein
MENEIKTAQNDVVVDNFPDEDRNFWIAMKITILFAVFVFDYFVFYQFPVWLFGLSAVIYVYKIFAITAFYAAVFMAFMFDDKTYGIITFKPTSR